MKRTLPYLAGLVSWLCLSLGAHAAERATLELKEGERIVLLGDDLIERNLKHGFLETSLTVLNPTKNLTFRNLGWSGDTVYGDARAGFGSRADGFKQLKEHVAALRPTMLLVAYGMSESFDGEAGIPAFTKGLNELLDVLAETKATIVLVAPIPHENLGRPLPDPAPHNAQLALYREVLARTADSRGLRYLDLGTIDAESGQTRGENGGTKPPLTDDGIHLSEFGYWVADSKLASELSGNSGNHWSVQVQPDGTVKATHADVSKIEASSRGARFEVRDRTLPRPRSVQADPSVRPEWLKDEVRVLAFEGLEPGRYTLKIDGETIATADAERWKSMELSRGPEFDQTQRLRRVINEKNLLYFYRWRPQNETYLFGFRKHEQGNNAREIPLFDPLVEAKEKEIAKLRAPESHVYELSRESEVGR